MKYFFLFFALVFLLGCSENEPMDLSSTPMQIKNIYLEGELYQSYGFQNGMISSYKSYGSNSVDQYHHIYEYTNDTTFEYYYHLIGADTANTQRLTKTYFLSQSVMRKDTYNENGTLFRYLIRTFQSNECGMTSQETTYAEDIWVDPIVYNVLGISSWEYLDENCSLMMSLHNASNSLVQTVENLRDNKKYSLDVLSNVWSHTENYGNVIQSTTMDEAGDINTFESFESTFQYNSSDYPISEIREFLDGRTEEYTYEYY